MFIGLSLGLTMICPTSGGLPTAAGLVDAMKKTPLDVALVVPSIIQELSQSPDLLDYCRSHLSYLVYCGGDLPQPIGDIVASKVKLVNQFGASEVGMLSSIHSKTNRNPQKDWRYIQFNPALGADLRRLTDDEYELFLVRTPEREAHILTFTMFPDLQEYSTKDLFVRHPDPNKPDLWRWSSRADDVIVFLNGEKTNPVSMEQQVTVANPEVTAALVVGAQRFQASLIVELAGKGLNPSERAAVIEKIWPSIEEANAVCPAHARIAKTHILFTKPDKPMLRSGKGTVQRAGTLTLYAQELDALYADADRLSSLAEGELPGPGRVSDAQLVSDFIRKSLSSIMGWSNDQLGDTNSFFDLGLDSLQAITATRWFKRGLAFPGFTPNLIYLHPSVSELTQAVLRLQQDHEFSEIASKEAQLKERSDLLGEFQSQIILPRRQGDANPSRSTHTVILTGSTGTLGTYILDVLLKNPSVAHVHCLNRKADSAAVQRQKSDFYGLDLPLDASRVSFWNVDLLQKDLSLSEDILKTLQETATLVIHNAWAVNFNLSLASFKPHLSGVVNLINFCSSSAKFPHLFFISSVSSVMGHQTESHVTPEAVIKTDTPAPNGYANSKYLAEQLLDYAARECSIRTSFARLGQIAGAVRSKGLWNKTEWFPSLVLSSLHVGAVPESIGSRLDRIDWVPIDLLTEVLSDLILRGEDPGIPTQSPGVFHPLNLHPVKWEDIRPVVVDALSKHTGKCVEVIPAQSWLQRVRQNLENNRALGDRELQILLLKNPAAKLSGFFEESMSSHLGPDNLLDTTLTAMGSDTLRGVDGIKSKWVQKWVDEWIQ
jgi:nucleoside-diphosphate-sugar epimerase